jgi:hypothetical protein
MHDDPDGQPDQPIDDAIDEAEVESFPASDPQSSWAGPDQGVRASEASPGRAPLSKSGGDGPPGGRVAG